MCLLAQQIDKDRREAAKKEYDEALAIYKEKSPIWANADKLYTKAIVSNNKILAKRRMMESAITGESVKITIVGKHNRFEGTMEVDKTEVTDKYDIKVDELRKSSPDGIIDLSPLSDYGEKPIEPRYPKLLQSPSIKYTFDKVPNVPCVSCAHSCWQVIHNNERYTLTNCLCTLYQKIMVSRTERIEAEDKTKMAFPAMCTGNALYIEDILSLAEADVSELDPAIYAEICKLDILYDGVHYPAEIDISDPLFADFGVPE